MGNSEQYQKIEELGKGQSGEVYKAKKRDDNKFYAIKRISLENDDNECLLNASKEAKILNEIDNENIVKYYDSFAKDKCFYIVMEYCDNSDLNKYIKEHKKENKKIDKNVIYMIILDICLGLKEIHLKDLIHRDLKPANIFISKDYKIKIGDLGIAKKLSSGSNYAKTQVGTGRYMAPEIINGESYNNKVDIWALGCIIYELCTLNPCFDCEYMMGLVNQINNCDYSKKDINDKSWQNIIELLLIKDHHKRPDINQVYQLIIKNVIIKKNFDEKYLKSLDKISLNILNRIIIKN